MRINCCHKFLAFILKFLNFLQLFLGISTVIYSSCFLNQWENRVPMAPSSTPSVAPAPNYLLPVYYSAGLLDFFNLAPEAVSGSELDLMARLHFIQLPAPWFIYFLMAVGVSLCCMSCIGHIAAEAINGCCLCFYTLLAIVLILLEAALVVFVVIDQRWEKDLPFDPTGELDKIRSFVEENADLSKWVGIALLIVQALSLLLSLILRAMISSQRSDSDVEDGYAAASDNVREPLLNLQPNSSSGLSKVEGRGSLSDIFAARIRQKYGLKNESSKGQSLDQKAAPSTTS